MTPARPAVAPSSPIRNRNFALLWGGGLVSDLGDWMLLVALPVYVFQLTGSALIMSTVFVVELVPALLFGQVAGVLVDRWDRRRVLVVGGVVQAALLVPLLAATTPDGSSPVTARPWMWWPCPAGVVVLPCSGASPMHTPSSWIWHR